MHINMSTHVLMVEVLGSIIGGDPPGGCLYILLDDPSLSLLILELELCLAEGLPDSFEYRFTGTSIAHTGVCVYVCVCVRVCVYVCACVRVVCIRVCVCV